MDNIDFQGVNASEFITLSESVNSKVEDYKIKFETLQQVCDLLSDLINNFEWSELEKNQLVYVWTQVIKLYWSLCEKLHIDPLPKL